MTDRSPCLKLKACDAEDLKVIAACLQDAIVPITEMGYLPDQQCFAMVANRFMWEMAETDQGFLRSNCAFSVLGVTAVSRQKIDLRNRSLILNLLTLLPTADGLEIIFAGGGTLHLTAPHWRCLIEDIGPPWTTPTLPQHETMERDERRENRRCEASF